MDWEASEFWGPIVAGAVLIVIGLAELLKYRRFHQRARNADGIVVDMSCGVAAYAGPVAYHPVLQFRTREGRVVRATSRVGSYPAPAQIGERVKVAYDPRDPEVAEIVGLECTRRALLCVLVAAGGLLVGSAWL
jgi:Protein of unknown function (DUF3592)